MNKNSPYQFTLVLANLDENAPKLEDSLFEAGCNDALINFRNGTVYLDFDRKAASLEEAVMSAIKNVEASSIEAIVATVAPENLVTESDIAKRLNINRQTVSLWIKGERRKSQPFPKAMMKLADKSPFWKWREVVEWLYQNELIQDKEIVKNAFFLENVNAVLEERNSDSSEYRVNLLKKIRFKNLKKQNPLDNGKNI